MSLTKTLCIGLAVVAGGCGGETGSTGDEPVVVATTTQLGDLVRNVAGSEADVHQILQANSDPHEYEPRPADSKAAAGAVLVVRSGNGLDDWIADVVQGAGGDPDQLVIAPDHTPHRVAGADGEELDPHWWHDPRNVEAAVAAIRDALVRAAPKRAAAFRSNADAYVAKVRALDAGIATCIDQVPPAERKLVTSHDAFGYFTARYGITVVGAVFPAQSTRAQPSAQAIDELRALVRREHVKAIFPESAINPGVVQALARDTGARADFELYGDALGPEDSPADTYLRMEATNADAMVRGFTGGARGCSIAGL
jgi:zinc/manganese transport system substrate-binding protein